MLYKFKDKYPKIADDAYVAPNAVIIGDVEIESKASVWHGCVLRGDVNYIRVGKGANIQDNSTVHVSRYVGPTIIGEGVTIGHSVILHACTLQDHSFVGMGAILLDGSVIETEAMIAAGSLLPAHKQIPSTQLWMGSPAKFTRLLTQKEIDYIYISKQNYIELALQYAKDK